MRTLLAALLLAPLLASAQLYRWVDDKGRIHYGDKPPAGVKAARTAENRVSTVASQQTASASTAPASPARPASASAAPSAQPVVMYGTDWCPYCARARKHFAQRGIAFQEKDIEKSPTWKREYDALGGRGVPVILVGQQRMDGYDANRLDRMLQGNGR